MIKHEAEGFMVTSPVIRPTSWNSSENSLYFWLDRALIGVVYITLCLFFKDRAMAYLQRISMLLWIIHALVFFSLAVFTKNKTTNFGSHKKYCTLYTSNWCHIAKHQTVHIMFNMNYCLVYKLLLISKTNYIAYNCVITSLINNYIIFESKKKVK